MAAVTARLALSAAAPPSASSPLAAWVPASLRGPGVADDQLEVSIRSDAHILLDGEEWIPRTVEGIEENGNGDDSDDGLDGNDHNQGDVENDDDGDNGDDHDQDPAGDDDDMEVDARGAGAAAAAIASMGRAFREEEWMVRRGQWRIRVQPIPGGEGSGGDSVRREVVLDAVKIEAYSHERARNAQRPFLS